MFQFPRLPLSLPIYSEMRNQAWPWLGFPIRTFTDQSLFGSSPQLFAAYHVLLRCLYVKAFVVCSLVTFYDWDTHPRRNIYLYCIDMTSCSYSLLTFSPIQEGTRFYYSLFVVYYLIVKDSKLGALVRQDWGLIRCTAVIGLKFICWCTPVFPQVVQQHIN